MSENILQTLQQLIQDVIAPDVRELKVRMTALEKQSETQYNALQKQSEAQFRALMAAIGESRAYAELETLRAVSALSERIAVLESTRH